MVIGVEVVGRTFGVARVRAARPMAVWLEVEEHFTPALEPVAGVSVIGRDVGAVAVGTLKDRYCVGRRFQPVHVPERLDNGTKRIYLVHRRVFIHGITARVIGEPLRPLWIGRTDANRINVRDIGSKSINPRVVGWIAVSGLRQPAVIVIGIHGEGKTDLPQV